jgi:hypothetical protein
MPDEATARILEFGGGPDSSVFSPVVLAIILTCGILMWLLPRSKAIVPFFAAAVIIPLDQVIVAGSLHFPMLRLLILFGLARIFFSKLSGKDEVFSGGINTIDKAMIVLSIFTLINGILLWRQAQQVIYELGGILTGLGSYMVLRYLIRDDEDVKRTLRTWAFVTVTLALVMIGEQVLRKNLIFLTFGGARAAVSVETMVRDGSLRARASFLHPILAGTFGGFSLPLFFALWWKSKKGRAYAVAGVVASVIMCITASSSTATMGLVGGLLALSFWGMRKKMQTVRRGLVALLAVLQVYLLAHKGRPIWHVIVDVDFTGSSSSWHRYMLVDECIKHFFDWALIGTQNYGSWGWEMWDLSNQYVATADVSGLIPLIALLTTVVVALKYVGRARQFADGDKQQEHFIWAIGAAVFANLIAFIGISYFDQIIVGWYTILAMVCAISLPARTALTAAVPQSAPLPSGRRSLKPALAQTSATPRLLGLRKERL